MLGSGVRIISSSVAEGDRQLDQEARFELLVPQAADATLCGGISTVRVRRQRLSWDTNYPTDKELVWIIVSSGDAPCALLFDQTPVAPVKAK